TGFCAELSGSITRFLSTSLGIPVSTTHTITGSIIGVGSTQSVSAVRWGLAGNILWAWILTIPCSAFIAGLSWWVAHISLRCLSVRDWDHTLAVLAVARCCSFLTFRW